LGVIAELRASEGDFKHSWDPNDPDSVKNAEQMFNDLKKQGYLMFLPDGDGRGKEVKKFDPSIKEILYAEKIVAVPRSRGG